MSKSSFVLSSRGRTLGKEWTKSQPKSGSKCGRGGVAAEGCSSTRMMMGAVSRDRTAEGRRRRRRQQQEQEQQEQQQLAQSRRMVQAARCRRTRARARPPTAALQETSMLGNAVVLLAQQRDRSCATCRRQRRISTADFPHGAIMRIYFRANAPAIRNRFTWFLQQHKYAALR
jgi:hypothetical protein